MCGQALARDRGRSAIASRLDVTVLAGVFVVRVGRRSRGWMWRSHLALLAPLTV